MKHLICVLLLFTLLISVFSGSSSADDYYDSLYNNPPVGWNVQPVQDGNSNFPLKAPASISVSDTENGVLVQWSAVEGAENYRVNYKTKSGDWKKAGITSETKYEVSGLTLGTEYTFRVRCVNTDGSEYTSTHIQSEKYTKYLAAPIVNSAVNTASGIKISWNPINGAKNYRVFYKPEGGKWNIAGSTTETEYEITGLPFGTEYAFTLRCMNPKETLFTSKYDPDGMSILRYFDSPEITALESTSKGVIVTWTAVENAEKYRVRYKTGEGDWIKAADTEETTCSIKGLKPGAEYYISVRCINSAGTDYTSEAGVASPVTMKKGIVPFFTYKFGKNN